MLKINAAKLESLIQAMTTDANLAVEANEISIGRFLYKRGRSAVIQIVIKETTHNHNIHDAFNCVAIDEEEHQSDQ